MGVNVEISSIVGVEPYDIYVCNTGFTTCIYISTIVDADLTYIFSVPSLLESVPTLTLKIVDDDNCTILNNFNT
jgi:hypothetical protein